MIAALGEDERGAARFQSRQHIIKNERIARFVLSQSGDTWGISSWGLELVSARRNHAAHHIHGSPD